MTAFARSLIVLSIPIAAPVAFAADEGTAPRDKPAATKPTDKPPAPKAEDKCEHGVKKTICARCNPKLEPVFRAKGDWCEEHKRPESQCVICHPDLKNKGVK
jgi:hypothetical protein